MKQVKGDIFKEVKDCTIIAHGVNCIGKWGKGFVMPLAKYYPRSKTAYLEKYKDKGWKLGETQIVYAEPKNRMYIANCASQYDIYGYKKGKVDLDYEALFHSLKKVFKFAKENDLKVALPKIGCGLAGGDLKKVIKIIEGIEEHFGIESTMYFID